MRVLYFARFGIAFALIAVAAIFLWISVRES